MVRIQVRRCAECQKEFAWIEGREWGYTERRGRAFCSYGCMRRFDREHYAREREKIERELRGVRCADGT